MQHLGYNDNVNKPPLQHDPLEMAPQAASFAIRMAFLVVFFLFLTAAILIAKII